MTADRAPDRLRLIDTGLLFREANRRIEDASEGFRAPAAEFFCECGDSHCTQRIRLTLAEYEMIRSLPGRFLTSRGHEGGPFRQVVESNDRFSIVMDLARTGAQRRPRSHGFGRGYATS